jgi:pyrroline-5-carboxylate reductase
MNLNEKHLAVIGAGNIGKILIDRLRAVGVPTDHLVVCESDPERSLTLADKYGIRPVILTDETICKADAILVAVSPKSVADVIHTIADQLLPDRLVISFAAAVPLAHIEAMLHPGIPVVRIMPNAPSLIGMGMNPVVYGSSVTSEARKLVDAILAALGETLVVQDDQMNWCVGLSGAAMRSHLPALEGMIQAGIEAGLVEAEARKIAGQVLLGTAALILNTDLSIDQIKMLTPMQTVDETTLAQIYYDAALQAKSKIDMLQKKLTEL